MLCKNNMHGCQDVLTFKIVLGVEVVLQKKGVDNVFLIVLLMINYQLIKVKRKKNTKKVKRNIKKYGRRIKKTEKSCTKK